MNEPDLMHARVKFVLEQAKEATTSARAAIGTRRLDENRQQHRERCKQLRKEGRL